ncbi:hypothetical protein FJT64_004162 [Amphibalanus amphitrite]|uniref:Uncharacterized protein n=1 Tax=Amphibalanus amphitrite TaxID=1232801 RepID=A0A6A4VWD5_AMPAM|nr:hypothetical protein FJT64_004162 [Amphibalanus amphitrite]
MEAYCVGSEQASRIFNGYPYKTYQPPSLGDEEFDLPSLMSDHGSQQQQQGLYSSSLQMSMPMTSTVETMTSVGYHPHQQHHQQHHQQPVYFQDR